MPQNRQVQRRSAGLGGNHGEPARPLHLLQPLPLLLRHAGQQPHEDLLQPAHVHRVPRGRRRGRPREFTPRRNRQGRPAHAVTQAEEEGGDLDHYQGRSDARTLDPT